MQPHILHEYHVFLASPGDMEPERQEVRSFFEAYNRHTASRWNVRFTVVDWENYSTIGVGRPQELISQQTLERFKNSLALVVGLMGQRFGSPTGTHESGTEEEFEWAYENHKQTGLPEIKWFFRRIDRFEALSSDPDDIRTALDQWIKVRAFRERMETANPPLYYRPFSDFTEFSNVFREDLSRWLSSDERCWYTSPKQEKTSPAIPGLSSAYYESLVNEFKSLDIAGIDNDRVVDIPLSEVYVRLRVIKDEDSSVEDDVVDGEPIDIHAALGKYKDLVIVGDPGSGKSTFLKFIALSLARAQVENDPGLATSKLNLQIPLPTPFFVSLWDLSDFLKQTKQAGDGAIIQFIVDQLTEKDVPISSEDLEALLAVGSCCVLFDGLDEVPTEQGRSVISRSVEKFVARHSKNRFVVTSRVRGYTGDTILKGGFVRCDIQNFNKIDRQEFLKNWFAALLRVDRDHVLTEGTASFQAYETLRTAIEGKDRIRLLAVNPLLMTVIAIVHWNRKRLPDQRVDIYDECVDVLLGQRKAAERTGRLRTTEVFDEAIEEEVQYDRAWTRKRFAEIALRILETGMDEITRDLVLNLLQQRFGDRPATTQERARLYAERFLDRQELSSGLLVSRRSHSCRFVHLTFQEYLAAWNLSNLSVEDIKTTVASHLRDPRWFEPLQLLGGELAKVSDEKLDQYIGYLLSNLGSSLRMQAPLIALCANILQDVREVADVSVETQKLYVSALRGTLEAFRVDSGVPAKTQLEVLNALIPLGASVKEHLIQATKSSHRTVRSQAVSLLVPHLPDEDLFSMVHILIDRSQEPILTYLGALLERNKARALTLLSSTDYSGDKTSKAVLMLLIRHRDKVRSEDILPILRRALEQTPISSLWDISWYLSTRPYLWEELRDAISSWLREGSENLRFKSLRLISLPYHRNNEILTLVQERATEDPADKVRQEALRILGVSFSIEKTSGFLRQRALEDEASSVRSIALQSLVHQHRVANSHSIEIGRKLVSLTHDLSGWSSFLDPRIPLDQAWIDHCSRELGISSDEVRTWIVELAEHLPIQLDSK